LGTVWRATGKEGRQEAIREVCRAQLAEIEQAGGGKGGELCLQARHSAYGSAVHEQGKGLGAAGQQGLL
jgi:hypothetical protein